MSRYPTKNVCDARKRELVVGDLVFAGIAMIVTALLTIGLMQ